MRVRGKKIEILRIDPKTTHKSTPKTVEAFSVTFLG
jgi:hypothetical protein